jgi:hypothetical protein
MTNPKMRIAMSVFEENVTSACKEHLGYIITKSPVTTAKFLTDMTRPAIDPGNKGYHPMYVSFDMTKWSPKMNW